MSDPTHADERPRPFDAVFLISLVCVAGIGIGG